MNLEILLTRDNSSMASTWTEMLGIEKHQNEKWIIGTCMHEPVGTFDDIDPDKLYDDDGDVVIPDQVNGKKVLGLADGDWFYGEAIGMNDPSIVFDKSTIDLAISFLKENGWDLEPEFEIALNKIYQVVGAV